MSDHSFNPFVAQKYGVNEAIIINNLIFWTRTNAASQKNFHEGRYWCYGTPEFFAKYFPYFTLSQIRYAVRGLVKNGALIKNRFNKKGYDRTNWYSLSDSLLCELNLDITCLQPAPSLIGQNCLMDRTKLSNGSDKIVRPIPVTKPVTKPVTIFIPPNPQTDPESGESQVTENPESGKTRCLENPTLNNKGGLVSTDDLVNTDTSLSVSLSPGQNPEPLRTDVRENKNDTLTDSPALLESPAQKQQGDDMNLNYEYPDTLYTAENPSNRGMAVRTASNPPASTGSSKKMAQKENNELAIVLDNNPLEIELDAIQSWLKIREKRKALVTPRVWKLLSKELMKFENPHEAFDLMIMQGWTTIRYEWVNRRNKEGVGGFNHTDTSWINKKDMFD